jgi:mannose-6-phosphate isomerase
MSRIKDEFDVVSETRPWGEFHEYRNGVKILVVNANEAFSLQYHHKRGEFWEVLEGTPLITVGEKTVEAKKGDRFFVPVETLHRINGGPTGTRIFELATGEFDEADIVRIEDNYGRK